VLAAAGVFLLQRPKRTASEAGGIKRVAVLPFENLGAPEDDYFADGIADAVRGKLTSLPSVQVIARGSSTPYRKTTKTPDQIARELDVGYLLTATVRWQKTPGTSRVQVSPELIEVTGSGAPTSKWQQPFDASLTDVFQVQADIATRVAHALGGALVAGDAQRLSEKPTQNLAAYDAFLRGEEVENTRGGDPASLRTMLALYEEAVALDPDFAVAWARVGRTAALLYNNTVPTAELAGRSRQAAEKAIALAPERPDGYLAMGLFEALVARDLNRALEQNTRARSLAPGDAGTLAATGTVESSLARWDSSVEHLRQAERLDPRAAWIKERLGEILVYLRRYPEARETLDRGLAVAPANMGLRESKAMTFLAQGDLAGARAVLAAAPAEVEPAALVAFVATYQDLVWLLDETHRELLLRLTPAAFDNDRGVRGIVFAQAYALNQDVANVRTYAEEARRAVEEQVRAGPEDPARHAVLGLALAYLGRKEEAIREGRRAVELLPVARDAVTGPYFQHQLARILILVGEHEQALDQLESLMKIPNVLSPGWLKIDPEFDALRGNPRFQKLVAGST